MTLQVANAKTTLLMTSLTKNPKLKKKCLIETRRLLDSVKGLKSSVTLAAIELWPEMY